MGCRSYAAFLYLIILATLSTSRAIPSCSGRWQLLTSAIDRISNLTCGLPFGVQRSTYACTSNRQVLRTERSLIEPQTVTCLNLNGTEFETCEGTCDFRTIQIELNCSRRGVERFCSFKYVIENCNIMHWSTWETVASCTGSNYQKRLSRSCLDCNNNMVPFSYCNGSSMNELECQVFWSQWGPWSACASNNSSATVTRTRSCYYETAEKVPQGVPLCPDVLKSETETCIIERSTKLATERATSDTGTTATITSTTISTPETTSETVTTETRKTTATTTTTKLTKTIISTTNPPTTKSTLFETSIKTTNFARPKTVSSFSSVYFEPTRSMSSLSTGNTRIATKSTDFSLTEKIPDNNDRNLQNSNPFLGLFLWVTIPIAILFLIALIVLVALLSSKVNCKSHNADEASQLTRGVIGPLNGDLYSSIVRK